MEDQKKENLWKKSLLNLISKKGADAKWIDPNAEPEIERAYQILRKSGGEMAEIEKASSILGAQTTIIQAETEALVEARRKENGYKKRYTTVKERKDIKTIYLTRAKLRFFKEHGLLDEEEGLYKECFERLREAENRIIKRSQVREEILKGVKDVLKKVDSTPLGNGLEERILNIVEEELLKTEGAPITVFSPKIGIVEDKVVLVEIPFKEKKEEISPIEISAEEKRKEKTLVDEVKERLAKEIPFSPEEAQKLWGAIDWAIRHTPRAQEDPEWKNKLEKVEEELELRIINDLQPRQYPKGFYEKVRKRGRGK